MPDQVEPADRSPTKTADKLTSALMSAATLSAIGGFGILFSIWWRSGISDNYEVLRIASQEFVNGRPIIAGDLAETVEFDEPASQTDTTDGGDPPQNDEKLSNAEIARREAIEKARQKLKEWIRLRDFLIGAGKVARSRNEADSRDQRQLLLEAIAQIQKAGDLTPQSAAWRDSLFTLAELLYQRGYRTYPEAEIEDLPERLELLRNNQPTLEEAVAYLDQAVDRYKWIPRAESAAYMSARRSLRTRSDPQLQVALDGFTQLHKHLLSREDERGLPVCEQRLLRNCYVAEADVLREMERLDEADMLIRQTSVVLSRIPQEWNGRCEETTRYDRKGWQELLAWMNMRIDNDV